MNFNSSHNSTPATEKSGDKLLTFSDLTPVLDRNSVCHSPHCSNLKEPAKCIPRSGPSQALVMIE